MTLVFASLTEPTPRTSAFLSAPNILLNERPNNFILLFSFIHSSETYSQTQSETYFQTQ